uniref:uncharacterized protein LOC120338450 n=1 Tax=Styela clava TaxID=7725 RepID=UPI00193A0296|nr:uncharacterized protein LOC120338450 [Styela clava]
MDGRTASTSSNNRQINNGEQACASSNAPEASVLYEENNNEEKRNQVRQQKGRPHALSHASGERWMARNRCEVRTSRATRQLSQGNVNPYYHHHAAAHLSKIHDQPNVSEREETQKPTERVKITNNINQHQPVIGQQYVHQGPVNIYTVEPAPPGMEPAESREHDDETKDSVTAANEKYLQRLADDYKESVNKATREHIRKILQADHMFGDTEFILIDLGKAKQSRGSVHYNFETALGLDELLELQSSNHNRTIIVGGAGQGKTISALRYADLVLNKR